jgi:hypothetical protein
LAISALSVGGGVDGVVEVSVVWDWREEPYYFVAAVPTAPTVAAPSRQATTAVMTVRLMPPGCTAFPKES